MIDAVQRPSSPPVVSYIHPVSVDSRRRTVVVDVGGVKVGSARPIVVQSMTNTDTADVAATAGQVRALHEAGSELVRGTVNNDAGGQGGPAIRAGADRPGCR